MVGTVPAALQSARLIAATGCTHHGIQTTHLLCTSKRRPEVLRRRVFITKRAFHSGLGAISLLTAEKRSTWFHPASQSLAWFSVSGHGRESTSRHTLCIKSYSNSVQVPAASFTFFPSSEAVTSVG
jgi:hypothetical protein